MQLLGIFPPFLALWSCTLIPTLSHALIAVQEAPSRAYTQVNETVSSFTIISYISLAVMGLDCSMPASPYVSDRCMYMRQEGADGHYRVE